MTDELATLSWDSEFFGFAVGRWSSGDASASTVARVLAEARGRGLRLLYWIAAPGAEAAALVNTGACLVDRKVTYVAGTSRAKAASHPRVHCTHTRTERLLSLTLQSGEYSRFRVDPRMPAGAFERMYAIWLDRSLSGDIAKEVLVFTESGQEVGFLTLGIKNSRPDIGLLAVDSSARGRGVGMALVDTALARAYEWGCSSIQVVTQQDNVPACQLYERCGFGEESVHRIYHVWL